MINIGASLEIKRAHSFFWMDQMQEKKANISLCASNIEVFVKQVQHLQ